MLTKKFKGIFVIFVLGVLACVGYLLWQGNHSTASSRFSNFPEEIGEYELKQTFTGMPALQSINKLHGVEIKIEEGAILIYSGQENMMIWMSESANEEEARDLFTIMDDKIKAGNTLKNYQIVNIKDQDMVYVEGGGQVHYYWQVGIMNYWVALAGRNDGTIEQVMESLKTTSY